MYFVYNGEYIISEEQLKTLMKEIFKEEFEKQQKYLLNLICGNFDVTITTYIYIIYFIFHHL